VRQRTGATRLGDGVLGGAAAPAGHRPGLLQLLLIRGQQGLDHLGQLIDGDVELVDAAEHLREQRGELAGEELRAFQRVLQLGDLAAGAAPRQLGQHLRAGFPGDEVVHDVPAGHSVQVGDDAGQLDRGGFQQLLRALLLPGPLPGQVPPVAGVLPDHPELRRGHEAGSDRAPLKARCQPPRVRRVPLGPPGQVPDLLRVREHALEPLSLQPAERPLPVIGGGLHHHRGHLPAPQPVRQRQHLPPGGAEAAGLGRPPRRVSV
jgi:hypothetical protein